MAMYYYASKISAIACGTRCRQTVLQKSRGQRDRDKNHHHQHPQHHQHHHSTHPHHHSRQHAGSYGTDCTTDTDDELDTDGICIRMQRRSDNNEFGGSGSGSGMASDGRIYVTNTNDNGTTETSVSTLVAAANGTNGGSGPNNSMDGIRYRRRYSEQLDAYDIELGFQKIEVSSANTTKNYLNGYGLGYTNLASSDLVQYDVPKNTHKRSQCDVNFESSVLGSGGIMYINGRIVSGPLESLVDVLVPKNIIDLDKEFIFSFLLSSRLYLRPHELLGKLLSSVPDSESLESLVALLAEWTNKFPYDYRDERMMSHVKHIVARCSNTRLEAIVSEILSALLKRLTDLERHEEELRSCQTSNNVIANTTAAAATSTEKSEAKLFECPTSTQYAQILCRIEKKLAKHIGPEEFVQCSSNVLLDKQKKWDQPSSSGGPPGVQDPKKTCNLETYLDWSARLRLFVCNEILQCGGIQERSRCVELWSGVAQYCLLVGNYNSATAILETLESPPIARLKITWSKLQVTCQQLDCMQRHAEGHGNLWHKQAIVLNENHHQQQLHEQQRQQQHQQHQQQQQQMLQQKTDIHLTLANQLILSTSSSTATNVTALTDTTTTADVEVEVETETSSTVLSAVSHEESGLAIAIATSTSPTSYGSSIIKGPITASTPSSSSSPTPPQPQPQPPLLLLPQTAEDVLHKPLNVTTANTSPIAHLQTPSSTNALNSFNVIPLQSSTPPAHAATTVKASSSSSSSANKPNDWVVIPVFADIVKLALAGREDCLQRLPNGHININAFDRMAAIVGAFTKHMQSVKTTDAPTTTAIAAATTVSTPSAIVTITPASTMQPPTTNPSATAAAAAGEYQMFCRHMQKTTKLSENGEYKLIFKITKMNW